MDSNYSTIGLGRETLRMGVDINLTGKFRKSVELYLFRMLWAGLPPEDNYNRDLLNTLREDVTNFSYPFSLSHESEN